MSIIVVADDHPLYRSALVDALRRVFPGSDDSSFLSIIESNDFKSTVEALTRHPGSELLLLDLHMPGNFGFLGLAQLRKKFPSVPVVVISASDNIDVVRRVMSFGASAFIPKSASDTEIATALHSVTAGNLWVPSNMRKQILESHDRSEDDDLASKVARLSNQQYKVLCYLTEGWLNKQIAHDMNITEATVKAHISAIFRKLGCNNRTQVVILAQQLRLELPGTPDPDKGTEE